MALRLDIIPLFFALLSVTLELVFQERATVPGMVPPFLDTQTMLLRGPEFSSQYMRKLAS